MVHTSNANLAPYVPDKIPRHTEYQRQFKQQNHGGPLVQDQLMQNAQQEIKAKYRVKTKVSIISGRTESNSVICQIIN